MNNTPKTFILYFLFLFFINTQAQAEEGQPLSTMDTFLSFADAKINSVDTKDPESVGRAFIRLLQTKKYTLAVQHVIERDRSGFLYVCYNELNKFPPIPKDPQIVISNIENKRATLSVSNWHKKIGFDLIWQQNRWWIRK